MSDNEKFDQENVRDSGLNEKEEVSRRPCRDFGHSDNDDAWWEDRSTVAKVFMGIGFGILGIGLIVLLIFVVMSLWNWLMPEIFGLGTINFWKSAGLMALCFILFKSWGSGSSSRRNDRKRKRHLKQYMKEDPAESPEA